LQQTQFKFKHYLYLLITTLISILIIYSAYGNLASNGYLGSNAQEKFIQQSSGSFGILLGSRQEIIVSSLAIYDSPIIGHGSWAKDEQYTDLLRVFMSDFDYEVASIAYDGENYGLIPTHSFLLGAWVYSGIFGAVFWFYIFYITVHGIAASTRLKSQYKLFIIYISVALLWDILFSPLGLYSRIYASLMIVVVLTSKSINRKKYKAIIEK
jgi:O-antigen ligase